MSMAAVVIPIVCRSPHNTLTNCFNLCLGLSSHVLHNPHKLPTLFLTPLKRTCTTHVICHAKKEEKLVVVGGGAAGVYGAIHAKTIAPHLNVVIIEKGKPLSKVKVSGGGRCNVTNGHCVDNLVIILSL
ncbi:FAD/NAD(P)-binding oxidoreductase family protein [Trifolium pratense]|uniref:FAD/NAD(P)-binding oxidoreductase family protein n=1 Tax=Trifolium pratense TaxID=57577 RepID=A0A2K3LQG8_TRIPR|nr:FAD/NAD(P)-binding oxidoreductase family protein [Trifolium pratense]